MVEFCDLLVTGDYALLPDMSLAQDVGLAVRDRRIIGFDTRSLILKAYQPAQHLDGTGKVILPGFVDAHTHAAQQFLRGRIVDELPMVWARILVPYESRLTAEDVYAGTLLCCVEMIKRGVTAFAEAGGPHAGTMAHAAHQSGLRAVICRSTMDSGEFVPEAMREDPLEAAARTAELRKAWGKDGRVQIWYSIRQIMTSTPELIRAMAQGACAEGAGLHLHLAEYPAEVDHCLINFRRRPVEWLADLGVLGPNVLAAHAILLSEREAMLLAQSKVRVVHCPPTNMSNNGPGRTRLLQALGVPIALGSDGAAHYGIDPFRLMRLLKYNVQLTQGLPVNDPAALPAVEVLRMATQGGAAALQLEGEIGALAVGKKADLVLLSWRQPHLWPTSNLLETIVLSAAGGDVSDVIVDGQILLKDRLLVGLDEQEVMARAVESHQRILRRN
ncbi:MAG: amidohydrolase family protein [Spirochaetota bacterium]